MYPNKLYSQIHARFTSYSNMSNVSAKKVDKDARAGSLMAIGLIAVITVVASLVC